MTHSDCNGIGQVTCYACNGSKTKVCTNCSGSGTKTCGTCNGVGTVKTSHNCTAHDLWSSHYYCSEHGKNVSQYH